MRRDWLNSLIREVHLQSRGTDGSRRVHAELIETMGVFVSERLVVVPMHNTGIYGLSGPARAKRLRGIVTDDNLVNRRFRRGHSCELWDTVIMNNPH